MEPNGWHEKYATGVRSIDADHRRIFAIVEGLEARIKAGINVDEVMGVAHELVLYIGEHFDREELYMRSAGYPNLPRHKAAHEDLREVVFGLGRIYDEDPASISPDKLLSFLERWLVQHIVTHDFEMAKFFRAENVVERDESARIVEVRVKVEERNAQLVRDFAELVNSSPGASEKFESAIRRSIQDKKSRAHERAKKIFCKQQIHLS